jgi:hypothetical protein
MREETRKRLDRLQLGDLLGWLPAFAIVALLLAALVALHMSTGDARRVLATVESADWRLNEDTGQHYPHIEVKLDTGASVRVGSFATTLPAIGQRITVRQRALLFEYLTTYEWPGPDAPMAAAPIGPPPPTPVSLP